MQRKENEKWVGIDGFPGYEVSSFGRVRSLDRFITRPRNTKHGKIFVTYRLKGKVLAGNYNKDGYRYHVAHDINFNKKVLYVHRLVAKAFVPNPNNLPIVNHKDENKANNHASNLEWCTIQYNNTYGHANAKRSRSVTATKSKQVPDIEEMDMDGNVLNVYCSMSDAHRKTGVTLSKICLACNGKMDYTGGVKFPKRRWRKRKSA